MQNLLFETSAHAKCILAGEHSVLRGYPAIVLPIKKKTLKLMSVADMSHQSIELLDHLYAKDPVSFLFWKSLKHSLSYLDKSIDSIGEQFYLVNEIDIGAGIGFSAALCVVIGRWLAWKKWIDLDDIFHLARKLENSYHGQSSGLDIAGSMSDQIISFNMTTLIRPIKTNWFPNLYISYCGTPKNTEEAVLQLKKLAEKHPKLARMIDEDMAKSVYLIEESLKRDKDSGLSLLASAIEQACHCFKEWELITPNLQNHLDLLQNSGAFAAKPTGAGKGGYVISLWGDKPPKEIDIELIAI